MAVNNNAYKALNNLVQYATSGQADEIVDYATLVEVGKKITDMSHTDWQNNFINAFANRIIKIIDTARNYEGKYKDLTLGDIPVGNAIELIIQHFYDAEAAEFVNLQEGQSVDQYKIYKPKADVDYFVDSNTYKIPITIQYEQVKKAFTSIGEMDNFFRGVMMYIMNSNELRREAGRAALMADAIVEASTATAATGPNDAARRYPLLTMYNAIAGVNLTADNCLYNEEFVKFMGKQIKMIMKKTENPSTSFNKNGILTFTKPENRHLFVASPATSSMEAYIRSTSNRDPDAVMFTNYIDVPFWQNEKNPLVVTYKDSGGQEKTTAPVVAMLTDKYNIAEYLFKQDLRTTPFNAAGEYWNYFLNVETRLLRCDSANCVIFTLE